MIADPLLTKLKLSIANLSGQFKLIDMTLEHKKGDVVAILKEIKEAKCEALAISKVMRAQLVVANSLLPKIVTPA